MENVSRAVLMAGGILIAVLIVTLLVVARTQWGKYQQRKDNAKESEQIAEFNERFETYNSVITGSKIVSLVNLAKDMNIKYGEDQGYKDVKIYAKLMNKNGTFPGSTRSVHSKTRQEYSEMNAYIEDIRSKHFFDGQIQEDDATYKEFVSQFKKAYFKCTDIVYNKENARVYEMYFDEVKKKGK